MTEFKITSILKFVKMKMSFLILLAGFTCVNSYSVIQVPDDSKPTFKVYWNMPTIQCASKRIPFTHLHQAFGVVQNQHDSFNGEKLSILYHPGKFPGAEAGAFKHGGIPQRGDLEAHLEQFRSDLESKIPDEGFDGLGIIDMERWKPIFHQNFGNVIFVKNESYHHVKDGRRWWKESWLQAEAKHNFELKAREFMERTLAAAKEMRPLAQWGYYGYPYCYNMEGTSRQETCSDRTQLQNDDAYWLWAESTAMYPSVYSRKELSRSQRASLIKGRVAEAERVAAEDTPIYPYLKLQYENGGFFTREDLEAVLDALNTTKANGVIIWGASNNVDTPAKCRTLLNYINEVFGPAVIKYTMPVVQRHPDPAPRTDDQTITAPGQTPSLVDVLLQNINTTNAMREDITIVIIRKSYANPASGPYVNSKYPTPININFNEIHYHNSNNMDVLDLNKDLGLVNSNKNEINSTDNIISDKNVVHNTDDQNEVLTEVNSTGTDNKTQIVKMNYLVNSNVTNTLKSSVTDSMVNKVSNVTDVASTTSIDKINSNKDKTVANIDDHIDKNNMDRNTTEVDKTEVKYADRNVIEIDNTKLRYADSNFTEVDKTEVKYADRNVIEIDNTKLRYADSNFTEVDKTKVKYTDSNFTKVDKTKVKYADSNFTEVNKTELKSADRNITKVDKTELKYADGNFTEVDKTQVKYADSNFTEVNKAEVKYTDSNFTEVDNAEVKYVDRNVTEVDNTEVNYAPRNFTEVDNAEVNYAHRNVTEVDNTEVNYADRNVTEVEHAEVKRRK